MTQTRMRSLLSMLIAAFSFSADVVAAERRIVIESDEPFYITAGPHSEERSSVDGTCYGAGCGDQQSGGVPERPGLNPSVPPAEVSKDLIDEIPYEQLKELMSGGKGIDDPRWSGAFDISNSGQGKGANSPLAIDAIVNRLINIRLFMPPAIVRDTIADFEKTKNLVAAGQYIVVRQPIPFPSLPSEAELRETVINQAFEPVFTNPGLQDRGGHHNWWMNRAREKIIKEYGGMFGSMESKIYEMQKIMISDIKGKFEIIREDAEAVVDTNSAGAEDIATAYEAIAEKDKLVTTVDLKQLVATQLPRQIQANYYLLPSDSEFYGYFADQDRIVRLDQPANRKFAETFRKIEETKPSSYQGVVAKKLAAYLAAWGNSRAGSTSAATRKQAEIARENALEVLDIALGNLPVAGLARDMYEAYSGEDLMTGRELSPVERGLKVAIIASLGYAKLAPKEAVLRVARAIAVFTKRVLGRAEPQAIAIVTACGEAGKWPDMVAKLRRAADGVWEYRKEMGTSNDFSFAAGGRAEAGALGKAWVGEGAVRRVGRDGKEFFISRDGLTQYRPPEWKPKWGKWQAIFQKRLTPKGGWILNAHFNIEE